MKRLAFFLSLVLLLGLWPLACQSQVTVSGSGSTKVVPNDPTTGTIQAGLAKVGPTGAIRTTPSDTNVPIWVVVGGAGTNANVPAVLAVTGDVSCIMDQTLTNTRGMLVVPSPTANGQCHPIPVTTPPATGYAAGTMADNSTTAGQTALVSAQLINYQAGSGTGVGTLTSVGFTPPTLFTASGVPITSAGTIVQAWQTQAANCVVAGPASGAAAQPTCRPLALADMPAGTMTTCGGDLSGTPPNCVVTQASGTFQLSGDVSQTLSGDVGDYANCTGTVCRLNGGASDRLVTGLVPGAAADGRILPLCNVGTSNKITLVDENNITTPASSAANRLQFGANVTLRPKACKPLLYDATTAKWRLLDSALLDPFVIKTCTIPFGSTDPSSPPLSATDDVLAACGNNTQFDWHITSVKVLANAVTPAPAFNPILTGSTTTSILTTPCSPTAPGVWAACTLNTTIPPVVRSFSGAGSTTCSVGSCSVDANQEPVSGLVATYGLIELSGPLY